jgi:hypothetical protein
MPSTRSKNVTQHPGVVDKAAPRRTSQEVAAARQAKEDAKQEKARIKAAGIQRVAEYEKAQADGDALDATPQVVTKPKLKPLVRTRSYANVVADVVPDSDVDMSDGGLTSSFRPDRVEDSETAESNVDTDIIASPPRKKKKAVKGEVKIIKTAEVKVKKEKVPKPKVRDAIKAVQVDKVEKEEEPAKLKAFARITASDDILDLDPTPKPTKRQAPAIESDDEMDNIKRPLWKMPTLSEAGDVESIPKGRGEEKMKGKGKARADPQLGDDNGSDQRPDTKRVPPKSKRHVYSYFRLFLLSSASCSPSMQPRFIITFSVTQLPVGRKPFRPALMIGRRPFQAIRNQLAGQPPSVSPVVGPARQIALSHPLLTPAPGRLVTRC